MNNMKKKNQITWRFNESRGPLAYHSDQDPFHLWVYPETFATGRTEWVMCMYKVLPTFDCVKIFSGRYKSKAEAMIAAYREWEARR